MPLSLHVGVSGDILTGPGIQEWDVCLINRNPITQKVNLAVRPSIPKPPELLPAQPVRVTYSLVSS
jgi:hypothetical protein